MVWRRAKIHELKDLALFKQEYPATAAEAFEFSGHDSFIKPDKIMRARKATCEGIGPLVIGADPARFGDDRFSVAWRRGRKVFRVESRQKVGTVEGANWLKQVIDVDKPARVFLDLGGVGAGTFDILKSWGEPYDRLVVGINFGGEPQEPVRYLPGGSKEPGPRNRRAEMWDRSREWLKRPRWCGYPRSEFTACRRLRPWLQLRCEPAVAARKQGAHARSRHPQPGRMGRGGTDVCRAGEGRSPAARQ
jgi:hypothetical protein